jgi:DNA-binding transcriptional MerR regulator
MPSGRDAAGGRLRIVRLLSSVVKISDASRASGVSPRSLRFYEDEGLIVPGRCSNGYRDYCGTTIDRVLVIRSLLESGLPVKLIKEALPQLTLGGAGADLRTEFLDEVHGYRDRLAARIAALVAQQSALDAFLDRAGRGRR